MTEMRVRLAKLESVSARQERELDKLRSVIDEARALANQAKRLAESQSAGAARRGDRSEGRSAKADPAFLKFADEVEERVTKMERHAPDSEPIDLNRAEFDDLRRLGLSITDSAQLLASRDVRSGFTSLDELDELHGLTPEVVASIKARARV